MKLQDQTVFITGGSSGIGFELARRLIARRNTVLICGRSQHKLDQARTSLPQVHTFACDVSVAEERERVYHWITNNHPECNVVVNNAAIVHRTSFRDDDAVVEKAEREIATNLLAPFALCKLFLPLLERHERSAIVNITTGLVYAPRATYPMYNATKAALHSFTQVLRRQLHELPIDVIEVMMPVVDTPWHKGNAPAIAISPARAVDEMIAGIERGTQELHVGAVRRLYALSRIAPALAFTIINRLS